jgi:hypothetical protein
MYANKGPPCIRVTRENFNIMIPRLFSFFPNNVMRYSVQMNQGLGGYPLEARKIASALVMLLRASVGHANSSRHRVLDILLLL